MVTHSNTTDQNQTLIFPKSYYCKLFHLQNLTCDNYTLQCFTYIRDVTWRHIFIFVDQIQVSPWKNGIKQFGICFQIRRVIIMRTTFSSNHPLLRSRGLCGDCGVQLHAWQETAESDFALGRTPPMQSYHRWVRANLINPLRQSQKI